MDWYNIFKPPPPFPQQPPQLLQDIHGIPGISWDLSKNPLTPCKNGENPVKSHVYFVSWARGGGEGLITGASENGTQERNEDSPSG